MTINVTGMMIGYLTCITYDLITIHFQCNKNVTGPLMFPWAPANTKKLHMVVLPDMNSMKLVIPLLLLYWSIHTKDESKRGTAFAFIFGVN